MTSKKNDASGASAGIAVTPANSSSATADAFQQVNVGTGASLTYATKEGVPSFQATSTSANLFGGASVVWSLPNQSRVTGRVEFWLPSPGPVDTKYASTGSGNGVLWQLVRISGSGFEASFSISDRDATGLTPRRLTVTAGGVTIVSADVITFDQWFRLEYDFVSLNPTGSYDVRLYADRYTAVPAHQWSDTRSWPNSSTVNSIEIGPSFSLTSSNSTPISAWFGGLHVSDDGSLPPPANPPAVTPMLSTLTDDFPTVDSSKWAVIGPVAAVGGAVELGDNVTTGYLTSANKYQFDRAEVTVNAPGRSCSLWIDDAESADFVKILIDGEHATIRAQWTVVGSFGQSEPADWDIEQHRHIKIQRFDETASVAFMASPDGLEWEPLYQTGLPVNALRSTRAILSGDLASNLDKFNIVAVPPVEPPDPADPYDPGATVPPIGSPEVIEPICKSLLDFIREFSAAIKRPIRITGPTSIEVVDPAGPLPAGITASDADDLYSTTTHALTAGETVLSMDSGDLALNVAANVVNDDMRIVASGWRAPSPLPIYGLGTGPVKRVTLTFTPAGFRAALEFAPRPVPLVLKRST